MVALCNFNIHSPEVQMDFDAQGWIQKHHINLGGWWTAHATKLRWVIVPSVKPIETIGKNSIWNKIKLYSNFIDNVEARSLWWQGGRSIIWVVRVEMHLGIGFSALIKLEYAGRFVR